MIGLLEELVSCESPSTDAAATRACGEVVVREVQDRLGGSVERVVSGGRTHLRWSWGTPKVLVLGHLDTVWPLGTLARWPFSVSGDSATGPGVFDMKGGVVQALAALERLPALDGVSLLLTVDEELGSPTSADLVVASARDCDAVLVCEPAAQASLKLARKGIGLYEVAVTGRAAHAGLEPEKGANAGLALAHALVGMATLGDADRGTTVTPTLLSAGTTSNTVPAAARASLDVRCAEPAEFDRLDRELRAVLAAAERAVPGTALELRGGVNRPPLPRASSAGLFALAQRLHPGLTGVAVGGGSDGNFTAGAGIPTLDGLGAVGDGAHAEGEHLLVSQMEPRAALLAGLLTALL